MAHPQTLNDFSRGRRSAIVASLGAALLALGPFAVGVLLDRLRATTCELQPGTRADRTVC